MAARNRPFIGSVAALAILAVATATAAVGVGTIDAVQYEDERVVIDGRGYLLAPGVVPRGPGDAGNIVPLQMLRPGMAVRYELTDADDRAPRINSLQVLTGQ